MKIINNKDGSVTKIYDVAEAKLGVMKEDVSSMQEEGYSLTSGEPVERLQPILLGYKYTYTKNMYGKKQNKINVQI